MKRKAPAKVNLLLRISGKRDDGFHELISVMQSISLYDELIMRKLDKRGIALKCNCVITSEPHHNLVYKAADLFFTVTKILPAVEIELIKNIPTSAGLGGGSSDAATALLMLNEMWDNPLDLKSLEDLSASLGSDVPFFIHRGTCLATGRGEIIEPRPFIGKFLILLINPGFPVPTAQVYSSLNLDLTSKRPLHNILPASASGLLTVDKLKNYVHNDLELTVLKLFPKVGEALQWLKRNGSETATVSGSGGTVFGIFSDSGLANDAVARARDQFPWAHLATTVSGDVGD